PGVSRGVPLSDLGAERRRVGRRPGSAFFDRRPPAGGGNGPGGPGLRGPAATSHGDPPGVGEWWTAYVSNHVILLPNRAPRRAKGMCRVAGPGGDGPLRQ